MYFSSVGASAKMSILQVKCVIPGSEHLQSAIFYFDPGLHFISLASTKEGVFRCGSPLLPAPLAVKECLFYPGSV